MWSLDHLLGFPAERGLPRATAVARAAIALAAAGVALRLGAYATLSDNFNSTWLDADYYAALKHHFFEYAYYEHVKPPLLHLIHAVPAWLSTTQEGWGTTLMALMGLLDILASVLVFLTSVMLGGHIWIAWVAAALASNAWLVFDLSFLFYDSPALFFLAFFAYACARIVRSKGQSGYATAGIAGALLIAQATVQAAIVPVVLAILVIILRSDRWQISLRRGITALTLPLVVLSSLTVRNYLITGVPTTSSLGGHTLLLFAALEENWELDRLVEIARAAEAPDWYIWCFTHPQPTNDPESIVQRVWQPMVGACVPQVKLADGGQRSDWSSFRATLAAQGFDPAILRVVEADEAVERDRPYLRSGIAAYLGSFWMAQYNRISGQVAAHLFRSDPVRWLTQAKYIHGNMFRSEGPLLYPNLRIKFAPYAPILRSSLYNAALHGFSEVTRYAYVALPPVVLLLVGSAVAAGARRARSMADAWCPALGLIGAILFLAAAGAAVAEYIYAMDWFYYGSSRRVYRTVLIAVGILSIASTFLDLVQGNSRQRMAFSKESVAMWCLLIVPLLLMAVIFCTVVGTENDRFFMLLGPHLTVVAALLVSGAATAIDLMLPRRGGIPAAAENVR